VKNRNAIIQKQTTHYIKTPGKLYKISLSITAIGLYIYLASNREEFNPSVKVMAKALGVAPGTIEKYLKELKTRNLIKLIKPGGEKVISEYEFVPLSEWV
jgi:DNA-binding MarR family transcriptional regulator